MILGLFPCLGGAASHLLPAGGSTALCYGPYVVLPTTLHSVLGETKKQVGSHLPIGVPTFLGHNPPGESQGQPYLGSPDLTGLEME